jgi:hypothetical protein
MRSRTFSLLREDAVQTLAGAALVREVVTEKNLAVSQPPTLVFFSV